MSASTPPPTDTGDRPSPDPDAPAGVLAIPVQRGSRHRPPPGQGLPVTPRAGHLGPDRSARRLGLAAIVVGAMLAAGLLVVVRLSGPAEVVGPGSSVAVIGDSYSQGTTLGGLGDTNWTARLAGDRGWTMVDSALGGTGYVQTNGPLGAYATAQLDRALAAKPAMIVVQGSINDAMQPIDQVTAAAAALYARVRNEAPRTRLVVIGPFWPPARNGEALVLLRDGIGMAARDAGAVWIDPQTEGWFTPDVIGADGVHPTDAGHALMAERLGDDLRAAGL